MSNKSNKSPNLVTLAVSKHPKSEFLNEIFFFSVSASPSTSARLASRLATRAGSFTGNFSPYLYSSANVDGVLQLVQCEQI